MSNAKSVAAKRPCTPVGWSDTDWIAHLLTMPPIGYAVRDKLYGTTKIGVLRFCAEDEPGAFSVYTSPQPQQTEPSQDTPPQSAALAELITVCEQIVDAGHMNTEDLARLRAALEKQ